MGKTIGINLLMTLAAMFGGNAVAQNSAVADEQNIIINGTTTVIPDGNTVTLFRNDGDVGTAVATDTVKNGKFVLSTSYNDVKPTSKMSLLSFTPGIPMMPRNLITAPGARITVDASTPYIHTWPVISNVPEQEESDKFLTEAMDLWTKIQQADIEISKLRTDTTLTKEERIAKIGQIRTSTEALHDSIPLREIALLGGMNHSDIWFEKLISLARSSTYGDTCIYLNQLKDIYQSLPEAEKSSAEGKKVAKYLYPPKIVNVGDKFADTDLRDINGNVHHIADALGKWILLDFWSTGCGPCIMAIPELKQFAETNKERVEVISINTDTEKIWKKATEQHKLTGNNWIDPNGTSGLYLNYGIKGIPTFVIVDPEGTIRKKWSGYGKGIFDRHFRSLLNPKPAMNISKTETGTVINYPDYASNTTDGTIEVDRIELTPEATILTMHAYYIPGWWIKISPESWIETPDGKKYQVTSATDIELGKEYIVGADGQGVFTLIFPAIDNNTTTIDFQEGPKSDWRINGLKINNRQQ